SDSLDMLQKAPEGWSFLRPSPNVHILFLLLHRSDNNIHLFYTDEGPPARSQNGQNLSRYAGSLLSASSPSDPVPAARFPNLHCVLLHLNPAWSQHSSRFRLHQRKGWDRSPEPAVPDNMVPTRALWDPLSEQ